MQLGSAVKEFWLISKCRKLGRLHKLSGRLCRLLPARQSHCKADRRSSTRLRRQMQASPTFSHIRLLHTRSGELVRSSACTGEDDSIVWFYVHNNRLVASLCTGQLLYEHCCKGGSARLSLPLLSRTFTAAGSRMAAAIELKVLFLAREVIMVRGYRTIKTRSAVHQVANVQPTCDGVSTYILFAEFCI